MTERIITSSSVQYLNYTSLASPMPVRNTLPEDTYTRGEMKSKTRRDSVGVFEDPKNSSTDVKYDGL